MLYQCGERLPPETTPHRAVEHVAALIEQAIARAGVTSTDVLGVGVGMPIRVDVARGIYHYPPVYEWSDVEMGPALEYRLRLPVRVDNDVNTLAVAERQFGAGREVDNFLLVTTGRGVGLGIVIHGSIYRGADGAAGEFGHTVIDTSPDAPLCRCGKRGCLESIVSDYAIVRDLSADANSIGDTEDEFDACIARARAGDDAARAAFDRAGATLGAAIANLANLFNPSFVLLGGEGMRAAELIDEPLRAAVARHLSGTVYEGLPISVHITDDSAWARGAASLVLHEIFRPPQSETDEMQLVDDLLSASNGRRRGRRPRPRPLRSTVQTAPVGARCPCTTPRTRPKH